MIKAKAVPLCLFFVFKTGSSCFRTIRIYKPDQLFGKMNLPFNWSTCKFSRLNRYISYKISGCFWWIWRLSLLLVHSHAPRGFAPGTLVFPSPQEPTFPNSNLIWNARTRLNEFIRTAKCFVGKQIIVKRSKYFLFSDCDHFIFSTFILSMYG